MPRLVHSKQSLDIVKENYRQGGGNKVLTSYFLRPDQKAIIDGLAGQIGETQADVVRSIIDEWCEFVLRDCDG